MDERSGEPPRSKSSPRRSTPQSQPGELAESENLLDRVLISGKKARFCTREEIEAHAAAQEASAVALRLIANKIHR
jgi:hypothetical protein